MARFRRKRTIKKPRKVVKKNKRKIVNRTRSRTQSSRTSKASFRITKPSTNASKTSVTTQASSKVKDPPKVWENIVLHYLSKLRNVWQKKANGNESEHPVKGNREDIQSTFKRENMGDRKARVMKNVIKNMHPRPDKYSSKSKLIIDEVKRKSETGSVVGYDCYDIGKRKVLNIVSKALDYGLAHGIVSKSGKYFWLNHNNRFKTVATRIPTPRPTPKKILNRNVPKKHQRKKSSRKIKVKRRRPKKIESLYKRNKSYSASANKPTNRKTCNCPKCKSKRYFL